MMIAINEEILYKIVDYASDVGGIRERIASGKESEFISQNRAHKRYGKGNVTKWVKEGLIKKYKDADGKASSSVRYSLLELSSAAFKINCFKNLTPASKSDLTEFNITTT